MFRIPDYVAETGKTDWRDAGSQPALQADDAIGRNVTRLGVGIAALGDRQARERAARPRQAAHAQSQSQHQAQSQSQSQARPLSEQERQVQVHAERRKGEALDFQASRSFFAARAAADQAELEARTEAGPSGEGFTDIVGRKLDLVAETLFATLPAEAAVGLNARFEPEAERRLARAAAEEVRTRRDWTRAELAAMQQQLLADLAADPERFEELLELGTELASRNILPDAEKADLIKAWQRQAQTTLAGRLAETEDPQTLRALFGFAPAAGSADPNGQAGPDGAAPPPVELEDMILHPALAGGDEAALRKAFKLAVPDPRVSAVPMMERIDLVKAAEQRVALEHDRAAVEMMVLVRQDGAEIARTGLGLPRLAYEDVEAALGKKRADQWREDRIAGSRLFYALRGLETSPPSVIENRVTGLKPDPDDPDFTLKQRVWRGAREKADGIIALRAGDPVAAVAGVPEVKARLEATERAPTAANREHLSAARLKAQADAGIPATRQTVLTPQETRALADTVLGKAVGERAAALDDLTAALARDYGAYADEALIALLPSFVDDRDLLTAAVGKAIALEAELLPGQDHAHGRIERRMAAFGPAVDLETDRTLLGGFATLGEAEAPQSPNRLGRMVSARRRASASPLPR